MQLASSSVVPKPQDVKMARGLINEVFAGCKNQRLRGIGMANVHAKHTHCRKEKNLPTIC